jgi:hypothetical protein
MTDAAKRRQDLSDFLTLSALWGSSFLFMRLAATEFGALPTAGLRVGLAALFLLPILLLRGHGPALRAHWRPALFVGLLNSAAPFALLSWAVLHITTGLASILNATVPLFGALVAWAWLKDRPGPLARAGPGHRHCRCGPAGLGQGELQARGHAVGRCWPAWARRCATGWGPASPNATSAMCRQWPSPPAARWVQRWLWRCPPCGCGRPARPARPGLAGDHWWGWAVRVHRAWPTSCTSG